MKQASTKRGQLRAVALGISASAFAMACSFGEIDGNDPFQDIDAPAVDNVNVDPSDSNDADAIDNAGNGSSDGDVTDEPGGDDDVVDVPNEPAAPADPLLDEIWSAELGQQVQGILEANCAQCHSGAVASGEVDYILDLEELIDNGKLIPGDAENSTIYVRMEQGSMPPAFIRDQRPSRGDIQLVGQFITELGDLIGVADACEPLDDFMTYDEMFALMQQDVLRLDAEDRPFTRYLQVSYSSNAGQCGIELDRQRFALTKMVNSVSLNPRITQPVAIDSNELLYRIDIRDYDWDRGIDIDFDGVDDFVDAWDAILDAVGNYAVEFTGDEADVVNAETGTTVPMLPVNAFVQEVTQNELYYALTGTGNDLFAFEEQIGVNLQNSIDEGTIMRAGIKTSGVSKQDRVITRQDNGISGNLAYWLSFDFEDVVGNDSLYADPLDFQFAGGEAIYNLPNGMFAYLVAAANGALLNAAPNDVVQDPAQNNGIVVNGASCHSCHNAGIIPFSDTVKPYVLSRPQDFDADTFEDVIEQYPEPEVFDSIVQQDSQFFINATERTGVPAGTPDPISRVYLQFQLGDVTTALAAGELGVTPEQLLENANRLDPRLGGLTDGEGHTDRNTFTNLYLDSLCIMQSASQNQPANCQ